jgi:hypothetical protein
MMCVVSLKRVFGNFCEQIFWLDMPDTCPRDPRVPHPPPPFGEGRNFSYHRGGR